MPESARPCCTPCLVSLSLSLSPSLADLALSRLVSRLSLAHDAVSSWGYPHKPLFIVLQVLCLPDLIPWIYLSLSLYNHKGSDLVIPEWFSGFPYFLQSKSEFVNKEFMIWASVSPWSCICCLYRTSPFILVADSCWCMTETNTIL